MLAAINQIKSSFGTSSTIKKVIKIEKIRSEKGFSSYFFLLKDFNRLNVTISESFLG